MALGISFEPASEADFEELLALRSEAMRLYVRPSEQGRRIGASVLAQIFAEADAARLALRVGALRGSASNRFYARHGFEKVGESEWDVYYLRPCRGELKQLEAP